MKGQTRSMAGVVGILVILLLAGGVFAKIPEPDNIIYGLAGYGAVSIKLKVNDQQIADYTMGSNPDADGYYILRIPMDALEPEESGAAHSGDVAMIFVNDETEPVTSVTLGERGAVYRLDLGFTDVDGDGLPDSWEQQIVDADPNATSVYDILPGADFDGDGESNLTEYLNGTDPLDPMSMYAGDLNSDLYISLEDAILALKVVSGFETIGETIDSNASIGVKRVGIKDAAYIMQKVSGARE